MPSTSTTHQPRWNRLCKQQGLLLTGCLFFLLVSLLHLFSAELQFIVHQMKTRNDVGSISPGQLKVLAATAKAGAFWEQGPHSSLDTCEQTRSYQQAISKGCSVQKRRVYRLLVTGCGRSSTHHIAGGLQQLGIDIRHETLGSEGAIAWPYAVNDAHNYYPYQKYFHRLYKHTTFKHVVHLVRHPLKVIASEATFTPKSWDFIAKNTPQIPQLRNLPVLHQALIHWVTWNRNIETYATLRVRAEDPLSVEIICKEAEFPVDVCSRAKRLDTFVSANKRPHGTISWEQLFDIDPYFAEAAVQLASKYGYDVSDAKPFIGDQNHL
eukprot:m.183795 g.183795  ORF g.183795 m.183795 type:complete len:323 (+) comp14699_c0_seq1:168-1136(+)